VFAEKGQAMRMGFRKYGWYRKAFLEEDGTVIVTDLESSGDKAKDAEKKAVKRG